MGTKAITEVEYYDDIDNVIARNFFKADQTRNYDWLIVDYRSYKKYDHKVDLESVFVSIKDKYIDSIQNKEMIELMIDKANIEYNKHIYSKIEEIIAIGVNTFSKHDFYREKILLLLKKLDSFVNVKGEYVKELKKCKEKNAFFLVEIEEMEKEYLESNKSESKEVFDLDKVTQNIDSVLESSFMTNVDQVTLSYWVNKYNSFLKKLEYLEEQRIKQKIHGK